MVIQVLVVLDRIGISGELYSIVCIMFVCICSLCIYYLFSRCISVCVIYVFIYVDVYIPLLFSHLFAECFRDFTLEM